LEINELYTGP